MTDVELDLFTEADMYLFVEEGIRGGVSMISHRNTKANVPKIDDYNSSKPNEYLVHLDANNLYGLGYVTTSTNEIILNGWIMVKTSTSTIYQKIQILVTS